MGSTSRYGRATINPAAPSALGICDRCGFLFNLTDLRQQWDWAGTGMANRHLRVCRTCYDLPQEQLRAIILPPDPMPVRDPRPESYDVDQRNDYTLSKVIAKDFMFQAVSAMAAQLVDANYFIRATFDDTSAMTAELTVDSASLEVLFEAVSDVTATVRRTAFITASFDAVSDMTADPITEVINIITTVGEGSFVVPPGVTSIFAEGIGGGAGLSGTTGIDGRGGGAYAKVNSLSVTPGQTVYYRVGANAQDTWLNKITDNPPTLSTNGILAKAGSGSVGGSAAACVGDVAFSGGNGGDAVFGNGGGGGAAGPAGAGKNGGDGGAGGPAGGGGGGGGAAGASSTNGSTASGVLGGAGGQGPSGTGSGAGGTSGTPNGTAGTTGSGAGGGGGYADTTVTGNGGAGANGSGVWLSIGPGGGGGGSGYDDTPGINRLGGNGGLYGGGGGGGDENEGIGGQGVLIWGYG